MSTEDEFRILRERMVDEQLVGHGIVNPHVLESMRTVQRHKFVSADLNHLAYRDSPLPIGERQTISQPYIVALMTQMLRLTGHERVLEIGTGSGYQAAVLCTLCSYVYTLERSPQLAARAAAVLAELGHENVDIHVGDGSQGLPDMAPFDAIIVTAAAPVVPGPLCSQLDSQIGRMVIPVGDRGSQQLQLVIRDNDQWRIERSLPVRFVPLVGRYGFKPSQDDPAANA